MVAVPPALGVHQGLRANEGGSRSGLVAAIVSGVVLALVVGIALWSVVTF